MGFLVCAIIASGRRAPSNRRSSCNDGMFSDPGQQPLHLPCHSRSLVDSQRLPRTWPYPKTWAGAMRLYTMRAVFGSCHGSATGQAVSGIWDMHGIQSDLHVDGSIGDITLDEGCHWTSQSQSITCAERHGAQAVPSRELTTLVG